MLSGEEIQEEIQSGNLVIEPVPAAHSVQPASIDLRLYSEINVAGRETVRGMTLDPETLNIDDHIARYTDKVDISGDADLAIGTWPVRRRANAGIR